VPKRADLIREITEAARRAELKFMLLREGANHSIYDLDGVKIPIARHRELGSLYAETIFKECEAKLGKGWWR
jgi:hypothetical protein